MNSSRPGLRVRRPIQERAGVSGCGEALDDGTVASDGCNRRLQRKTSRFSDHANIFVSLSATNSKEHGRHRRTPGAVRSRKCPFHGETHPRARPLHAAGMPDPPVAAAGTPSAGERRGGALHRNAAAPLPRRKQPARTSAGADTRHAAGTGGGRTVPAPYRQLGDLRHHGKRHDRTGAESVFGR